MEVNDIMTKKPTRRDILKMSGSSISVTGFASGRASPSAAVATTSQTNLSPEARTESSLFRLINNSRGRGQTAVHLRHPPTGHLVKTFNLDTTGTNHPEMVDRPHKERFPHVAADVNSFGNIPGGEYVLEVQHQELIGKIHVYVDNGGLPPGYKIESYIMPDGRLEVEPVVVLPSRPSP